MLKRMLFRSALWSAKWSAIVESPIMFFCVNCPNLFVLFILFVICSNTHLVKAYLYKFFDVLYFMQNVAFIYCKLLYVCGSFKLFLEVACSVHWGILTAFSELSASLNQNIDLTLHPWLNQNEVLRAKQYVTFSDKTRRKAHEAFLRNTLGT